MREQMRPRSMRELRSSVSYANSMTLHARSYSCSKGFSLMGSEQVENVPS